MSNGDEIEKLQNKIILAERERDSCKRNNSPNFKMASHLLEKLKNQLRNLLKDSDTI